jgi:mannose-1-phosphate guanylyltransferase
MKISKQDVFIFILAGGKGTRFWPLSRKDQPKQFLKIFNKKSMLQTTYNRCLSLTADKNIFVVTSKDQDKDIRKQLPLIAKGNILIEPQARGTTAAIALSAAWARIKSNNSIMAVIPADQYIFHDRKFVNDIKNAILQAKKSQHLVTIGIKPTFAATGYGYLKFNKNKIKGSAGTYKIDKFIEKPTLNKAKRYIKSSDYYYNSGMFIWQTEVFLNELAKYMPHHHKAALYYIKAGKSKPQMKLADTFYKKLSTTSIDYGLMQKSNKILGIKAAFGWSDLGSLKSFEEIDLNAVNSNIIINALHLGSNTKNSIIYGESDKLIATLGIEDTIVVQTKDAILIAKKDNVQDVRSLVTKMAKNKKLKKYI